MEGAHLVSKAMPGREAKALLTLLSCWSNTTTIILHGGCVFEFKGVFPVGSEYEGFYNLESDGDGFHGHIKLSKIDRIVFQDSLHRGRQSYAFVFEDQEGATIFKVFLGRDSHGELYVDQVSAFKKIQQHLTIASVGE